MTFETIEMTFKTAVLQVLLLQDISRYTYGDATCVPSSNISAPTKICISPECVKSAAWIQSNLDESKDPCENFYQFACGGWMDQHETKRREKGVGVLTQVVKKWHQHLVDFLYMEFKGSQPKYVRKYKHILDACMYPERVKPIGQERLVQALEFLGGWPVLEGDNWEAKDWIDILVLISETGYSLNSLFQLAVEQDVHRNGTRNVITLDQPDKVNVWSAESSSILEGYYDQMVRTALNLGGENSTVRKEMQEAFNFELTLGNCTLPEEEKANVSEKNYFTVKELQQKMPQIDWMKLLSGLLNDTIDGNESVQIKTPEFFYRFHELINNTDKRTVSNYLLWRVAQSFSDIVWKLRIRKPWLFCYVPTNENLGIALNSHFVQTLFRNLRKEEVLLLKDYIIEEFLKTLNSSDWMHPDTKNLAVEQVKEFVLNVGFPPEFLNESLISDFYEDLTDGNDSYYDDYLNARRWKQNYEFSLLRKPNVRGSWKNMLMFKGYGVLDVTPINNLHQNSIEIPVAYILELMSPIFNKNRPKYMNFGSIGYVIAHEIGHFLDGFGQKVNKEGTLGDWWDKESLEIFGKKAECFVEQYSNYSAQHGLKLTEDKELRKSLNDNIDDTEGIRAAFQAYQSWVRDHGSEPQLPGLKYTPNQLFWISAASTWCHKYKAEDFIENLKKVHAPSPYRVNAPLSNNPDFAKDFKCSESSKMNPPNKCQMW